MGIGGFFDGPDRTRSQSRSLLPERSSPAVRYLVREGGSIPEAAPAFSRRVFITVPIPAEGIQATVKLKKEVSPFLRGESRGTKGARAL